MSSFRKKREHKRERETNRAGKRQTDRQMERGKTGQCYRVKRSRAFIAGQEREEKTAAAGSAEWGNFLKRLACGDLSICDFPESQTLTSM